MKLEYSLDPDRIDALQLADDETIWYCVPVDLGFDHNRHLARDTYCANDWLIVTEQRFLVLQDTCVSASFRLTDCEKIKCEHQVGSGIITVTPKGKPPVCAARFSMRHIIRVSSHKS
jgi:hypothetical protein